MTDCKKEPGQVRPVVDPAKCEGKADCVAVCPYDVFSVGRMEPEVFRSLPFKGKMKVFVHGMKTATTPNADACHACGLCVPACPEKAIRLLAYR